MTKSSALPSTTSGLGFPACSDNRPKRVLLPIPRRTPANNTSSCAAPQIMSRPPTQNSGSNFNDLITVIIMARPPQRHGFLLHHPSQVRAQR